MAEKQIMMVCGEASGDLHASHLIRALKQINPDISISGVGGALMRSSKAEVFYDIKGLAVLGLFDVLQKLPRFFHLRRLILQKIKEDKPDAIILIDFSGFNLRLAKKINKAIPVIYYISPQVWASRPGRIKTIKKYIHKMIVLFKFEEEFYRRQGIDTQCIGHPLLDIAQPSVTKEDFLHTHNLSNHKITVLLLPGSRNQEIENILPIMLKAAFLIRKEMPDTQFLIAKPPQLDMAVYNQYIQEYNLDLRVIEGKTYDCLDAADFCLVASGTATLETAIMQKPLVVIYKMSLGNYLLYRPQVRLPYIGMVNIVAGKKIIPEFIQFQATPEKIAHYVLGALNNPDQLNRNKNDLACVKSLLGEKGACLRAAGIIKDFLDKQD